MVMFPRLMVVVIPVPLVMLTSVLLVMLVILPPLLPRRHCVNPVAPPEHRPFVEVQTGLPPTVVPSANEPEPFE